MRVEIVWNDLPVNVVDFRSLQSKRTIRLADLFKHLIGMYIPMTPSQLVSDVVEKKHRLVVEVESLASSWKKYDASTSRRRRRRRKNEESRRTFNKNSGELLTAITHTEILVARCIFLIKSDSVSD